MPAIINSDDGVVSGSSGLKTSGANDGILALQNNGTTNATVTAAGNVGIGTSSPGQKLHVAGNIRTANSLIEDSSTNVNFGTTAAGYLAFLAGGGAERARIDSSGNVGVGTSSPGERLDVQSSSSPTIKVRNTANGIGNYSQIYFDVANSFSGTSASFVRSISLNAGNSSTALAFGTNADGGGAPAERARIDSSGNLLVGITSTGSTPTYGAAYIAGDRSVGSSNYYAQVFVPHNSATNHGIVVKELAASGIAIGFLNSSNSVVGSITTTNTATAYNTSSDYRLKEQVQPMTGALARVTALKPVTYKWKADGSDGEGFIAHELAEVCPQAVTGEKDAVDADGNPKYQGIDTSFLVATLTAAIQELKAELDATKAEVAALKAAAK